MASLSGVPSTPLWETHCWNPAAGTTLTMSASLNPSNALIFQCASGASIAGAGFTFTTLTSSPSVTVMLQALSAGIPKAGDIGGASPTGMSAALAANSHNEFTFTNAYTSTGDAIAAVVTIKNGQAINTSRGFGSSMLPRSYDSNSTRLGRPVGSIKLSDGTYVAGLEANASSTSYQKASNSTVFDEIGNRFVAPFTFDCPGAEFMLRLSPAGQSGSVRLYDANGSLIDSASVTIDDKYTGNSSNEYNCQVRFPNMIRLYSGRTYEICYRPETTTAAVYLREKLYSSEALKIASAGCGNLVHKLDGATVAGYPDVNGFAYITPLVSTIPVHIPSAGSSI